MGDIRLGERWSWGQRLRNDAIYGVAATALWAAVRGVPRGHLGAMGAALGTAADSMLPALRRRAESRLRGAYAGQPPVTTREVFEGLGRDLADAVSLLDDSEPVGRTMALAEDTEARIRDAMEGSRGVVFATAHLGSIERMAALVAARGYPVVTLARESYDPRFTALYERLRARRGVHTIYRGQAGAEVRMIRALRRGHLVGFPMDLAGRGMATVTRLFLGEPSEIPVGPAKIALRTGAAVLVGTPLPGPNGLPLVRVERVPTDCDAETLAARIASCLEARILKWPAHWPWMHGPIRPSEHGQQERGTRRREPGA